MRKALVRPPGEDRLDALIEAVVDDVYPLAREGPVASGVIGELVLRRLRSLDPASHVRFALGHLGRRDRAGAERGWRDVTDVLRWLREEYPALEHHHPVARLTYVIKRDGDREAFSRKKLERSIDVSSKGRGSGADVARLAAEVASDVEIALGDQPTVTTGQIAAEILRSLRGKDHIAYLRFVSTAKGFVSPEDYNAEATALRNRASVLHQR